MANPALSGRFWLKVLTLLFILAVLRASAQQTNGPHIEPCDCIFAADSAHKTRCGYLVVPENRQKPRGRMIKLPFIYVESTNLFKHSDPVLYTGGGPGVSSLHPVTSIGRRSLLRDRDYIAFEQRGTHFALPCLECQGLGEAVQRAYLTHRPVEEAVLKAVRTCREKLVGEGVDLSCYNTDESAADIEDLRRLLQIESLNLIGISYSGGLMTAVLQKYPHHIRSLILDSPLPEFVNIDEQELANFNEVLTTVLASADSHLTERFRDYFSGLDGRVFTNSYLLKDGRAVSLNYGRNELLSIIHAKLEDYEGIKELPQAIEEMVSGRHHQYIKSYFDGVFSGNGAVSGMRLSVYCSDKMAFEDTAIISLPQPTRPFWPRILTSLLVLSKSPCLPFPIFLQRMPSAPYCSPAARTRVILKRSFWFSLLFLFVFRSRQLTTFNGNGKRIIREHLKLTSTHSLAYGYIPEIRLTNTFQGRNCWNANLGVWLTRITETRWDRARKLSKRDRIQKQCQRCKRPRRTQWWPESTAVSASVPSRIFAHARSAVGGVSLSGQEVAVTVSPAQNAAYASSLSTPLAGQPPISGTDAKAARRLREVVRRRANAPSASLGPQSEICAWRAGRWRRGDFGEKWSP